MSKSSQTKTKTKTYKLTKEKNIDTGTGTGTSSSKSKEGPFDITIKEISYYVNSYDFTRLELDISGTDINYTIVNSLRKICMDQIPIYGIPTQKIKILRNSSVYDGTEMRNRLSQLPIKRLQKSNNVLFLPQRYYTNVDFSDINMPRHPDDETNVEFYLNVKHTGHEKARYVTTDDLRISINNEIIPNNEMYKGKEPIVLIKLRPGEEFECSMKSVLCVGEWDAIFNASNVYYEEITPSHFKMKIESYGQFNEYELLTRGIDIIIEKMSVIKQNIMSDQYMSFVANKNSVMINMINEDHTCAGPINYVLQGMEEVIYSGVSKTNFMEKNIKFMLMVKDGEEPLQMIGKSIDKCIEMYQYIKYCVKKLYPN